MSKKSFKTAPKPDSANTVEAIDRFVTSGHGKDGKTETQKTVKTEETRRLTVDMPKSLHLRFKALCAQNELKMNDEVRQMIAKHCEDLESRGRV